jgi:hypothetical protein
MSTDRDDDALSWAGENDPTLIPGAGTDLPEGWTRAQAETLSTAPGAGHRSSPADHDPEPTSPAVTADHTGAAGRTGTAEQTDQASPLTLVTMGVLGGVYLLYTVGWFIGASRIGVPASDPVAQFMFSLGAWLAVASPVVWFGVTFWLTVSRPRARILWLLAGAVLLAPLPVVIGSGGLS